MEWNTIFLKNVEKFIMSQPQNVRVSLLRHVELLNRHGIDLGMPYVKFIENKIYELRIKESSNNYRLFYFAHIDKKFVVVHGIIKKTQKTPREDIELSIKRMNDFIRVNKKNG